MKLDFSSYFKKYESLVTQVDDSFKKIQEDHSECIKCKKGCSECCYAVFDLSLVEALYINFHFNRLFQDKIKNDILDKADVADRKVYVIKRKAYKDSQDGIEHKEILRNLAKARIRCPLLNEENLCDMYENRPITCRLYGVPTSYEGNGYTCGKSGFEMGVPYPTVKMEKVYDTLYNISFELFSSLETKYSKMADMMIPVSMAITTVFDEVYLGLKTPDNKDNKDNKDNNDNKDK